VNQPRLLLVEDEDDQQEQDGQGQDEQHVFFSR
jgi:hypothetical protein